MYTSWLFERCPRLRLKLLTDRADRLPPVASQRSEVRESAPPLRCSGCERSDGSRWSPSSKSEFWDLHQRNEAAAQEIATQPPFEDCVTTVGPSIWADYFGRPAAAAAGAFFLRGGVRVRRSKRGRIAVGSLLFGAEDRNGFVTCSGIIIQARSTRRVQNDAADSLMPTKALQ